MDLSFTPEEQKFREEIRAWVKENLPAEISHKVHNALELTRDDLQRWAKILGKKGWLGYGWPKEFGGPGWTAIEKHLFEEEAALAGMWVDAGPAFYLEHLKRLRKNRIQPYFVPGHVHQLELIERLIRAGVYMGPLNLAIAGYGGGTLGRNPFDWMEMVRRVPQGSVATFWSSMRGLISLSAMAFSSFSSCCR